MITGWEPPDALFAAIADAVTAYHDRIAADELSVVEGGVTVVISASGFLTDLRIDPKLRHRLPPERLATVITTAIGHAEKAARDRRIEETT